MWFSYVSEIWEIFISGWNSLQLCLKFDVTANQVFPSQCKKLNETTFILSGNSPKWWLHHLIVCFEDCDVSFRCCCSFVFSKTCEKRSKTHDAFGKVSYFSYYLIPHLQMYLHLDIHLWFCFLVCFKRVTKCSLVKP